MAPHRLDDVVAHQLIFELLVGAVAKLQVARQNGEVGGLDILQQGLLGVVKLVVAQHHGVVPGGVHQLKDAFALGEHREGLPLGGVARVQQQAVGGALFDGRDVGQVEGVADHRGVHVVGVVDGDGVRLCREGRRPHRHGQHQRPRQERGQCPFERSVHFFLPFSLQAAMVNYNLTI